MEGRSFLSDFYNCDPSLDNYLYEVDITRERLKALIENKKIKIIKEISIQYYPKIDYRGGYIIHMILSNGYIQINSIPELKFIAVDFFLESIEDDNINKVNSIFDSLRSIFNCNGFTFNEVKRFQFINREEKERY